MVVKDFIADLQKYSDNATVILKDENGKQYNMAVYGTTTNVGQSEEETLEIRIVSAMPTPPETAATEG